MNNMYQYKRILSFTFILVSIHFNSWSQKGFGNGYYIINNGEKIECLLQKPINNPNEIIIKKEENLLPDTISIHNVKEFKIYKHTKYKRFIVPENNSLKAIQRISTETNYDTLFLRYLVEGNANLYEYIDSNQMRYYFDINESEITYLIYEKYVNSENMLVEKNVFKQQLINNLSCPNFSKISISNLSYTRGALTKYFVEYLNCIGDLPITYKEKMNTYAKIKSGIGIPTMQFERGARKFNVIGINYNIGIEGGLYINNKLLLLLESLYSINKLSKVENFGTLRVDYNSVNFLAAVRYQINELNKKYNIYVAGGYKINMPLKGTIDFDGIIPINSFTTPFYNFIIDFSISKGNWSIEIRHNFSRKLIINGLESVYFQSFGILVGYNF